MLDQRRVDFLVAPPHSPAFVVEIDGQQHDDAFHVDASREAALNAAGYDVIRVPTEELRTFDGPNLRSIMARWQEPPPGDEELAIALATPAQLHRFLAGLLEAVQAGFLLGDRWVVGLRDDLGVVADHVPALLTMLAAVDDLWGQVVAPDVVELHDQLGDRLVRYTRLGLGYTADEVEAPEPVDVVVHVEARRTPVEALPDDNGFPAVVVRSAPLPVEVQNPIRGVSRRTAAKTDREQTLEALRVLLQVVFAKEDFRPGQADAVVQVFQGGDCVVLLWC